MRTTLRVNPANGGHCFWSSQRAVSGVSESEVGWTVGEPSCPHKDDTKHLCVDGCSAENVITVAIGEDTMARRLTFSIFFFH